MSEVDLGMMGAEIGQEVAGGPAVVTSGIGIERGAEGIDGAVEGRGQRMLKRRPSRAVHDRCHRKRTDMLGHGARILKVDVLRSDLDIEQGGLDIGVSHQAA